MFTKSTEYYDRICAQFKDYPEEAQKIDALIQEKHPEARTILDIACGTGEHARLLSGQYGYTVDGIDIEKGFVEIANKKCPKGYFSVGDMTAFELSREYDVITCLFSAIGYVQTVGNTVKALRNFLNHLRPGGILLVEPWIDPAKFLAGAVFLRTVNDDDLKVARMSANEIDGKLSRITFEYLIGEGGRVTRETEVHELALLTRQEMANCFTEAGLEYEYDEFGLMDRGLFIGRR